MKQPNTGARKASEPEVYGAMEAALALGVSQTNLRVVANLPVPYQTLASGTLYRASDIDALAAKRTSRAKAA